MASGGGKVVGELLLHGKEKELVCEVRREGGRLVTRVPLHQPDFGIRPFSAFFNTLKVRPDLLVSLSVPAWA